MTFFDVFSSLLLLLAEFAFVLGISPLLVGILRKVRARSQRREGATVWQPYRDLRKLFSKGTVYAESSSAVTPYAPWISLAALLGAVPFIPWFFLPGPLGFAGDLIVVVGLLALSRFMTALAALDAGSTFGGMGSSRDMWIGALAEPTFLLVIFAWGAPAGSTQASTIALYGLTLGVYQLSPATILATVAFVLLLLTETGRLPVDNPATHLELTMIHEAMVLEYAGGDIALVTVGEAARLALLLGLMANLFLPWGIATHLSMGSIAVGLAVLIVKVAGFGTLVAAGEVFIAKVRLFRVPELMAGAFVLSVLAVVAAVVGA